MSQNKSNISFVKRVSTIRDFKGNILSQHDDVIFPKSWSQTSVDIVTSKYFRRKGVPVKLKKIPESDVPEFLWRSQAADDNDKFKSETDVREVFHRLVGAWAYHGIKAGYLKSHEDSLKFYDFVYQALIEQKMAPNSPQFFNTGLYWAYGITGGPNGHYYIDPYTEKATISDTEYARPQAHACFIISIHDTLMGQHGILDAIATEARIFKGGSGSGANYSRIRRVGSALSAGGSSSGLLSFLKAFDTMAGVIKSGGTTRRAAKMVVVDIDHPDIFEFVSWKNKEEYLKIASLYTGSHILADVIRNIKKACNSFSSNPFSLKENKALSKVVYNAITSLHVPEIMIDHIITNLKNEQSNEFTPLAMDFDGEIYQSVTAQNANNTVSLTEDFLNKAVNNKNFDLFDYNENRVVKTVKAKDLLDHIAYNTWSCADPGIHYSDTIQQWHTCPQSGPIRASNPCSEYLFLDNTGCNLASINLLKFYVNQVFDYEGYYNLCMVTALILEITNFMSHYPTQAIALATYTYRTVGLGFCNLGGLFLAQGIGYDSDRARTQAAFLSALMTAAVYEKSSELASMSGPFKGYEKNKKDMMRVMRNHRNAAQGLPLEGCKTPYMSVQWSLLPKESYQYMLQAWNRVIEQGTKFGFKNAQATLVAPTGTIGLAMDVDTTGIEPLFGLVTYKKCVGGGFLKIIPNIMNQGLCALGYSQEERQSITRYILGYLKIDDAPYVNKITLSQAGFTDELVKKVNTALQNAFTVADAFSISALGSSVYKQFKVPQNTNILDHIFQLSQDESNALRDYLFGRGSVIGAPCLQSHHTQIFATAVGDQALSWKSHLTMMAACQPFLSGGISKTVNLPQSASQSDVRDAILIARDLGLKAIAIYRDCSKFSQPLTGMQKSQFQSVIEYWSNRERPLVRGEREKLSSKISGYRRKVNIGNYTLYLHCNENSNGQVREVFASGCGTEGSTIRSLVSCFTKMLSLGLQHGVPLSSIIASFKDSKFEPSGFISNHPYIKRASSLCDFIVKELEYTYGKDTCKKVSPQQLLPALAKDTPTLQSTIQFTGDICPHCDSATMTRIGTCLQCHTCYYTTGCG